MWPPVGTQGGGRSAELTEWLGTRSRKDTGLPHYLFLLQSVTKVSTMQCFLPSGYFLLFCDAGATDRKKKVKKKGKKKGKKKIKEARSSRP